jgi:uracil-DNA glycosylase
LIFLDSKPESHKHCGWESFTDYVIKVINEEHKGIIFLLWGNPAQKKARFVDRTK